MNNITLSEFRDLPLGLKDTILDKIGDVGLQAFIDTATMQVNNYCNRQLASAPVVQSLDGNGQLSFLLREYPVTALTSVAYEDDSGVTGTEDVALLRVSTSGVLSWKNPRNGPFLRGRFYTITYTAGYATVPGPIKHATALWVTELLQPTFNQGSGGKPASLVELSSEQIGELLEEYRRKGAR